MQSISDRGQHKHISLGKTAVLFLSLSPVYKAAKATKHWDSKENMADAIKFIKRSSVLKRAVQVLQRSLPFSKMKPAPPLIRGYLSEEFEEEADRIGVVPEDVKEGHFAVVAVFDEKPKRIVVSLSCLSHPMFLRLLELAEEEFGFQQQGPLAIPCRPSDLENIIREL